MMESGERRERKNLQKKLEENNLNENRKNSFLSFLSFPSVLLRSKLLFFQPHLLHLLFLLPAAQHERAVPERALQGPGVGVLGQAHEAALGAAAELHDEGALRV